MYMSLIFYLSENDGGFFCQIWKLVSNYLYAKKYNLQFLIDDSKWLFKNKLGWRDYFTSLSLVSEQTTIYNPIHDQCNIEDARLNQFSLNEYINAIKEIFVFNSNMDNIYKKKKALLPDMYNSIMIRRGCKMYGESKYISTDNYVKKLIEINNFDIFVQTDDYTAYEEVCKVVKDYGLNINVTTTCPLTQRGAFVFNYQPDIGSPISNLNNEYLLNLKNVNQKSINSYSAEEMKEHVEEMLIGLKLCAESNYLVTDFQSNVTRFLLCIHNNPAHILSIGDVNKPLFNVALKCPAHGFIASL